MHNVGRPKTCIQCKFRAAVTNDGKLCLTCLRKIIRELTPDVKNFSDILTEMGNRDAGDTSTATGGDREEPDTDS